MCIRLWGYLRDVTTLANLILEKLLSPSGTNNLKRFERKSSKVIFYFDEISSDCFTCIEFEIREKYKTSKTKRMAVKIYDYYEPSFLAIEASVIKNATFTYAWWKICSQFALGKNFYLLAFGTFWIMSNFVYCCFRL